MGERYRSGNRTAHHQSGSSLRSKWGNRHAGAWSGRSPQLVADVIQSRNRFGLYSHIDQQHQHLRPRSKLHLQAGRAQHRHRPGQPRHRSGSGCGTAAANSADASSSCAHRTRSTGRTAWNARGVGSGCSENALAHAGRWKHRRRDRHDCRESGVPGYPRRPFRGLHRRQR